MTKHMVTRMLRAIKKGIEEVEKGELEKERQRADIFAAKSLELHAELLDTQSWFYKFRELTKNHILSPTEENRNELISLLNISKEELDEAGIS